MHELLVCAEEEESDRNNGSQKQRSRRKENEAKRACGVMDNWSQFLVGFFRPVRRHPSDDGRLSEWATGWVEDHLFCQKVKVHFLFSVL